jgi:hypothetical protein
MLIGTLNVVVRYIPVRTAGPNGRAKMTTEIVIRMGNEPFASRTVGGRYSQADALKEFKRFPDRFTPAKGKDAKLVAAIAA